MKILIVDDDSDILKMITRTLEHAGHTVQGCTSAFGVSALVLREGYDLILIDVMMPGLDGPHLAALLGQLKLARRPQLVLWSAMDETRLRAVGLEAGLPTLSKSLHPSQLVAKLTKMATGTTGAYRAPKK